MSEDGLAWSVSPEQVQNVSSWTLTINLHRLGIRTKLNKLVFRELNSNFCFCKASCTVDFLHLWPERSNEEIVWCWFAHPVTQSELLPGTHNYCQQPTVKNPVAETRESLQQDSAFTKVFKGLFFFWCIGKSRLLDRPHLVGQEKDTRLFLQCSYGIIIIPVLNPCNLQLDGCLVGEQVSSAVTVICLGERLAPVRAPSTAARGG